ncbi:hypothetical protein DL96DRAFT_1564694 [Flagelloscypha sp. PMI_526]|nr:hypothetical protein DL96DRAFT_1564694 [Flagelloscypha sp. PMI_526]
MPSLRLTLFFLLAATCYAAAATVHHTRGLSNAERLKRGLPLKAPVFRRGTPTRRDSSPSGVPGLTTYTGYVQVLDPGTGDEIGWLTPSGEVVNPRRDDAIRIQFSTYPGSSSGLVATCLSCDGTPNIGMYTSLVPDAVIGFITTVAHNIWRENITHLSAEWYIEGQDQYDPQAWSFDSLNNDLGLSQKLEYGDTFSAMKIIGDDLFVVTSSEVPGPPVKLKLVSS